MKEKEWVFITGVGSGLGLAACQYYLKKGFTVFGVDKDEHKIHEIRKNTDSNLFYGFCEDLSNWKTIEKSVRTFAEKNSAPSAWWNNAGIVQFEKFTETSEDLFLQVINTNFLSLVSGTRLALDLMSHPERGQIFNISSVNGIIPAPYLTSYSASKHAVVGFTRSLQAELELEKSAIQVILVLPGFMKSSLHEKIKNFDFFNKIHPYFEETNRCVEEIISKASYGQKEMILTKNGKALNWVYKWSPRILPILQRSLVGKNWKEKIGLDPIEKI